MIRAGQRETLRELARESIHHGLRHARPVDVSVENWPEPLRRMGSSFVTLYLFEDLRGCVGALEASRPLVHDVAMNAYAAAFRDPRFHAVSGEDLRDLEIRLSLLSPLEPLAVASEADLLDHLRPGIDGLVLEEQDRRGTFLPAVWRSLPDPVEFLSHLRAKAGLPPDYWSESVRVYRYTTEEF